MSRALGAGSLVAAILATGCGAGEPPVVTNPELPKPRPAEPPPPPFVSPARWSFHPAAPASASATRELADGSCLVTTSEGSRFLAEHVTSDAPKVCRGKVQAASDMAEEPLVFALPKSKTSWLFVGESGALYEAEGPIAPLLRMIPAPAKLGRVDGGGGVVLATSVSGELFALEERSTWRRVTPPGSRIYDVAVAEDGRALALALPEALFVSDDGKTFRAATGAAPIGARRVGHTQEGALAAVGLREAIVWDPKTSSLDKRPATLADGPLALDLEPTLQPTATSVAEGRAVLDGDRYVEITAGDEGSDFSLAEGPLEGPLTRKALRGTSDCTGMKLGARGKHLFTGCMKSDESGDVVEIRASTDRGAHFGEPTRLHTDEREIVSIAVSSEGHALVTGVCKTRNANGGCSGAAPALVRSEGGRSTTTLAATPPLSGPPISPAFSVDGRSAYFLGRRAKDERLALFVSHDAGVTFSERALDPRAGRVERRPFEEGEEPPENNDLGLEPSDLTSLRPGDDGTIGITLMTSRGLSYFTTDEDGRVLGTTQAPMESALIGGSGRHVLAIAFLSGHERAIDDTADAWESLDGGATWSEIPTNPALSRELLEGSLTITCTTGGCLVGNTITRVGWNGQAEAPTPAAPRSPTPRQTPASRTPLVCELDPRVGWTLVENVDPIGQFGLPTLDQLARGRALWSVLSVDPEANAVTATAAISKERGDEEPRVTTRALLGPSPKGARVALDVSHQMEGYAAVRVRLPKEGPPSGPKRDLEIAWENFIDGTSGRARIPDAGSFSPGDVKRIGDREIFDTALVSVTAGGVFVRPSDADAKDLRTFLLDPRGKVAKTFSYPDWPSLLSRGAPQVRGDAALVDGTPLAVATAVDDALPFTMVLARQGEGGAWIPHAMSLAPGSAAEEGRLARNDWTYLGPSTIGAVAVVSEPLEGVASASFHAFRADGTFGPPLALPTPFDLPDVPRPCKADDRRATPRFAARMFVQGRPMFPGQRHPVLVAESATAKGPLTEPLALVTAGVVLHGTKSAPCVAAFEAIGVSLSTAGSVRMPVTAVIAGDPSRAWLFRVVSPPSLGDGSRGFAIEHRPMSCHFDPAATVPDRLLSQPGMSVTAPP